LITPDMRSVSRVINCSKSAGTVSGPV
jgi:hypothetical protein